MKNFKKLSILLLSVVMALSCACVWAFASEDEDAAKIAKIESLLEYYNDEGIFVCDDFDNSSSDLSVFFEVDSEGEYTTVDEKSVWSATLDGHNVLYSPEIFFAPTVRNVGIVFSFCLDADVENEDKGYLAFEFSGDSTTVANADGQSVLVLDYKEGKAYFASMDADKVLSSAPIEGFAPQNGVWYTISMLYSKKTNGFVGSVSDGTNTFEFDYVLTGISSLSTLAIRNRNLGNKDVTVSWDSLEIYEGTFIRSNFLGAREAYLDEKVYEYMLAYENEGDAVRAAIVETISDLFAAGYYPSAGSDAETYYNSEFSTSVIEFNWNQFSTKVAAFDKGLKYATRYANLTDAKDIEAAFPVKPDGVAEVTYNEAISAYEQELAELAVIEEYSKQVLALVTEDIDNMQYDDLLLWILEFQQARENLLRIDGSYDDTYKGVEFAVDIYENANDKLLNLKKLAIQFINAVDAMNMNYPTDFGVKYNAYVVARTIIASPEFNLFKDTYAASFYFIDSETVNYDGQEYEITSVSADGKSAVVMINSLPYTLTLKNHKLTLEGEGIAVVLDPADEATTGLALSGNWKSAETVAGAYAKYELRDDAIIEGQLACDTYITAINNALLAKGYFSRLEMSEKVNEAYGEDECAVFLENGKYFGYDGLQEAIDAFAEFEAQLLFDQLCCDLYIELVNALNGLDPVTDYQTIKEIVESVTELNDIIAHSDVADYENEVSTITEAEELFYVSINLVVLAETNAKIFIDNVTLASETEDLVTRLSYLRAAQKVYGELRDGADGVLEAKALFATEKAAYLADAQKMNDTAKNEGVKLVRIAFANLKVGVPDKAVFIIKKIYEL